ncbi:hypothetical protein H1R20_g9934, partial [Candolleomyces eurysporus]
MVAGLARTITLYLAPALALTATILSLLAFLAPTIALPGQVALLAVTPSTVLSQPGPSQVIDGPSVFLGILDAGLILGSGLTNLLILHIWFSKSIRDFNAMILAQDAQRPMLIAEIGNAFTMGWVAHSFLAVPIVISLTKLNVKTAA